MGQLNLVISTRRDAASLKKTFETPSASAKHEIAQHIDNFITAVHTGSALGPVGSAPSIAISILDNATAASGTLTVSAGGSTAAQAASIAGIALTAVASGPTANQFVVSATAATQAANMAAAINASASFAGIVTAVAVGAVVTITAAVTGKVGNGIAISAGNLANVAASGALLTAGAADPSALTLNF